MIPKKDFWFIIFILIAIVGVITTTVYAMSNYDKSNTEEIFSE